MEELLFSSEDILERVDEYTLYCSYLDYEPLIGAVYNSPIRSVSNANTDETPSFGLFTRVKAVKNMGVGDYPNEFLWKDQALGITGDIFELVRKMCKLQSRRAAMLQVMTDTGLLPGNKSAPIIDIRTKRFTGYADISIIPRQMYPEELHYWRKGNITLDILNRYAVHGVKVYWLYADQPFPRFGTSGSFAYQIWDKYQLYFTKEVKRYKFRTDWTEVCVPGFLQLKYQSDLLIITKSMKDIMVLASFGYEAISPRGENIMLPIECIAMMKRKYKRILILFDNDMKHKGDEYEFDKIYVPNLLPGDKDVFDYCCNHGIESTRKMLIEIIQ